MITKIHFYNYDGHPDKINKELSNGVIIEGTIRDSVNILNPTITLRLKNTPDFNYCYITDLDRYYFINNVTFIRGEVYECNLEIDVLKTYADEILSVEGRLIQSENVEPYISSSNDIYDIRPNFERMNFENGNLFDKDGTIIMTTIKG